MSASWGPCEYCGRSEHERVSVCCSAHNRRLCASCYCDTHLVEGATRDYLIRKARAAAEAEAAK